MKRGLIMRWTTWHATRLADIARHVIRCHLSQEMMVQNALYDVAGNICLSLTSLEPSLIAWQILLATS